MFTSIFLVGSTRQSFNKFLFGKCLFFGIHSSHTFICFVITITDHVSTVAVQRTIGIWVLQQVSDCSAQWLEGPRGNPLIFDDIEAHLSRLPVDIRVENTCFEVHFWWHYRVLLSQYDSHFENSLRIWTIVWSMNICQPIQYILLVEYQEKVRILMLTNFVGLFEQSLLVHLIISILVL